MFVFGAQGAAGKSLANAKAVNALLGAIIKEL
jgi:hypothetical protein